MKAAKKATKIKDKPVENVKQAEEQKPFTQSQFMAGYKTYQEQRNRKLSGFYLQKFKVEIENEKGGTLATVSEVIAQNKYEAIEQVKSKLVFTASRSI